VMLPLPLQHVVMESPVLNLITGSVLIPQPIPSVLVAITGEVLLATLLRAPLIAPQDHILALLILLV